MFGLVVLGIALFVLVAALAYGVYQTYRIEHQTNQKLFLSGTLPSPLPNDFYKGNQFTGLGDSWRGKVFDSSTQRGINKFGDGERFVFQTYPAQGLRDKHLQVLRIDYNQKGNPWWLHFIVDEVVQIEPDHYLGKVHVRVIPGLVFTLSYFELQK